jgi:hypothetical protein
VSEAERCDGGMKYAIIWFWITAIAIPITAVLAVAYATVWKRLNYKRATLVSRICAAVFVAAFLSNPLLNYLMFLPVYGGSVSSMLRALKAESYVGRTEAELVERFGRPEESRPGHFGGKELYYDCHPWFCWHYPEGVVVRVTDGNVVSFAYIH